MAKNEDKFILNEEVSSIGIVERLSRGVLYTFHPARDDDKLRFVVENAGATNQVIVRGRILNSENFDELATINGPSSRVININTYDEIQVEVTLFDAPSGRFKLLASGFSIASGDIEVSTPAGVSIPGTNSLEFTSNDSTVTISGDGEGAIDFSVPASVGANFKPEVVYTLTSTDITNKQVTLGSTPATANITQLFILDGGIATYGEDFIVAGNILSWNGLRIDGSLVAGEKIVIMHD